VAGPGQGYRPDTQAVIVDVQMQRAVARVQTHGRREPTERHPGRRRFSQAVPTETRQAFGLPAASRLAWLLIRSPEQLDEPQHSLLAHLLQHPNVAAGYTLAQQFSRIL
jgi:hypothetical protein